MTIVLIAMGASAGCVGLGILIGIFADWITARRQRLSPEQARKFIEDMAQVVDERDGTEESQ